jgi:hypothetical protein
MATATLRRPARVVLAMAGAAVFGGLLLVSGAAPASASAGTAARPAATDDMTPMVTCGTYASNKVLTRAQVFARGKSWVDQKVPYSQTACHSNAYGNYRRDCSGFVSMAWGLASSRTTANIRGVTTTISRASLRNGDALWRRSGGINHVALFVQWGPDGKTAYVLEESKPGTVAHVSHWSPSYGNTFTPIRYNNIR